jgi:hypothetical protein
MSEREDTIAERVGRNQSTFRDANERLETAAEAIAVDGPVPFICECARLDCTEVAALTLHEYEVVRGDPTRFWSVPGHETCEVEGVRVAKILELRDRYSVLEKIGHAAEVARERDARS